MEQVIASFAPLSPKHRRGAPIGNTNAIKHGLYCPRHNAAGLLRVLSMASTCLTNMLKARFLIFGDESQPTLSSALQAVLADMRAKKPGPCPCGIKELFRIVSQKQIKSFCPTQCFVSFAQSPTTCY